MREREEAETQAREAEQDRAGARNQAPSTGQDEDQQSQLAPQPSKKRKIAQLREKCKKLLKKVLDMERGPRKIEVHQTGDGTLPRSKSMPSILKKYLTFWKREPEAPEIRRGFSVQRRHVPEQAWGRIEKEPSSHTRECMEFMKPRSTGCLGKKHEDEPSHRSLHELDSEPDLLLGLSEQRARMAEETTRTMIALSEGQCSFTIAPAVEKGKRSRACYCFGIGPENQRDGNVHLVVGKGANINTYWNSEESLVQIEVKKNPMELERLDVPQSGSDLQKAPPAWIQGEIERGFADVRAAIQDAINSPLPKPVVTEVQGDRNGTPQMGPLDTYKKEYVESWVHIPELPLVGSCNGAHGSSVKSDVVLEPVWANGSNDARRMSMQQQGTGDSALMERPNTDRRTSVQSCTSDWRSSLLIEKPYCLLGSSYLDLEYTCLPYQNKDSRTYPHFPDLSSSATTSEFGFSPTCARMPGSWIVWDEYQSPPPPEPSTEVPRAWRDVTTTCVPGPPPISPSTSESCTSFETCRSSWSSPALRLEP